MRLKLPKQHHLHRQVESLRRKESLNGAALVEALDLGLDKKQLHSPEHQKAVGQVHALEALGVKAAAAFPLLYRRPLDLVLEVHPELRKAKWLKKAKPGYAKSQSQQLLIRTQS